MKIHGVLAALVTPMTVTEKVDLDRLAEMVDHLIVSGLHGLVPLGSTGEFYALSPGERKEVLEVTLSAAAGRVPVLAGANAGSTSEVVEYCRQAERMGASGILLAPPYYSRPTLDELYEHIRLANDAIGIPIMLYNYPGRTGVDMTPDFLLRLTDLDNVRYVKESTGEMERITRLIRTAGDRLGVFCGCDTLALECFTVGAIGWVGGVANVIPRQHARLYELAVERKDASSSRKLFYRMLPLLELMEGSGKYTQFVKAACGLTGHRVGPPRRPLLPATAQEKARLRQAIRSLGGRS
jgi:4-hydroxy-tetrahydrodipicolinate synthase